MNYKDVIAKLRNVPPPQQPWLLATTAEYSEKLVDWNPMCVKSSALYYQFTTGPRQDSCLLLPDACINILFKCSEEAPSLRITGIQDDVFQIELEPDTAYFGFKPFFLGGIKGLSSAAQELKNKTVPMEQVSPIHSELEQLLVTDSLDERIKIFQKYAMAYLVDEEYTTNFVEYCAILLCVTGGAIGAEELEANIGYSRRHCSERFREQYGITMKRYSRFLRMQRVLIRAMTDKNADMARIANDAGYFDQSHFIKEFKNLVSTTPNKFRDDFRVLMSANQRDYHPSAQASRMGSSVRRKQYYSSEN